MTIDGIGTIPMATLAWWAVAALAAVLVASLLERWGVLR